MDRLLTMKEIQERVRLGKNGTYSLVSRPDFPKITIGKKILCYEGDLDDYMHKYRKRTINLI